MRDVVCRKARPEDREKILAISAQIWDGEDYLPRVLDRWMEDEKGELSVALLDDRIVGVSKMTELIPGHGWLQGARVDPSIQGKGIGKALTQYHVELAREKGMSYLRMLTDDDNTASRTLGEKMGFKLVGEYFRYQAEPVRADGKSLPKFTGTLPKPENGLISVGWTFYPWDHGLMDEWAKEGMLYGSQEAGMIVPKSHRPGRVFISHVWGDEDKLKPLLELAKMQPEEVERVSCLVPDRAYHSLLTEAGFENKDENYMVVYELEV